MIEPAWLRTAADRGGQGVQHPVVQTGMGWVAGSRLVAATANAGGLGILASRDDDLRRGTRRGDPPRRSSRTAKPFGVNLRADAADASQRVDLLISQGVRVASFALSPRSRSSSRTAQGPRWHRS